MLSYPARIRSDGDTFMVSFPDLPGVFSQGDDREDAARHAVDALESGLYFLVREGEALPVPSAAGRGLVSIEVTFGFESKLLLVREMVAQKVRPTQLARRLGITPQEVNRLIDLRHRTKIDTVAAAIRALGKRLELSLAA
jgi:antitoxin HicB